MFWSLYLDSSTKKKKKRKETSVEFTMYSTLWLKHTVYETKGLLVIPSNG